MTAVITASMASAAGFHFQFLLVAICFVAKLIRWKRDGRLVHIFDPASFPLVVFALALIVTGQTDVTRAQDIAISQFYPPQMYLWDLPDCAARPVPLQRYRR